MSHHQFLLSMKQELATVALSDDDGSMLALPWGKTGYEHDQAFNSLDIMPDMLSLFPAEKAKIQISQYETGDANKHCILRSRTRTRDCKPTDVAPSCIVAQPQLEPIMQHKQEMPQHHQDYHINPSTSLGSIENIVRPLLKVQTLSSRRRQKRTSRDTKCRPLSLAATHPANYSQHLRQHTTPTKPPMGPTKQVIQQPTPSPSAPGTPQPPPPRQITHQPPWREYTDPMRQTSTDPNFWYNNCTILKCDRNLEPGNVISPTCMIGLPCGGMVEMASSYSRLD